MRSFHYIRPKEIDGVFSAIKEFPNAFLFAGGTDLLVGIKNNLIDLECIIDLKGLPHMASLEHENVWKFGALMNVRDIEVSNTLHEKMPFLCQAASSLGSVQIRNRATLGGNLCNASPAADMATIFLAMDSKVKIESAGNEKIVGLNAFFTGPKSTIISKGEMLTEIVVPKYMEHFKGTYLKVGRRRGMDIGIVSVGIVLDADAKTGLCNKINIALGAVASTPIRAKRAEEVLDGNILSPSLIARAAELAVDETEPISDYRASASYRKHLVGELVERGINQILSDRHES